MFTIQCTCGNMLKVGYDQVNQTGRCPKCSNVFTIPAPPDTNVGWLKCTCGLKMQYHYKDAGKLSACRQCNATFRIPGGTTETMMDQLEKEMQAKRAAQLEKVQTGPEGQVQRAPRAAVDILEEYTGHGNSNVIADYEHFGFWRWFVGAAVVFGIFAGGAALLMLAQGKLKLPDQLFASASSDESEEKEDANNNAAAAPGPVVALPPNQMERKPDQTVANPKDDKLTKPKIHIGRSKPNVPDAIAKKLATPFQSGMPSKARAEAIAIKIEKAINENDSSQIVSLMDPEVTGNYLFSNGSMTPVDRYYFGSEALKLYRNNVRISRFFPNAKRFPSIEMSGATVPIIRVCSNPRIRRVARPGIPRGMVEHTLTSSSGATPELKELEKEYIKLREDMDANLPSEWDNPVGMPVFAGEQITPINEVLDQTLLYFAVITAKNRDGVEVLVDLAGISADINLSYTTWDDINDNSPSVPFDATRPNENGKYLTEFKAATSSKTVADIFKANYAKSKARLHFTSSRRQRQIDEEQKMSEPSPDDCLDALEDLEKMFPDDSQIAMLQYMTAKRAGFKKELKKLFDRASSLGCASIELYEERAKECASEGNAVELRRAIDALRKNCKH